ncbi:glycosyltransferase family 4 protein [Opitutaceae bacterium]|nr:glycosyltransferase family 4 protein [Opitutaceae bacterium]
MLLYDLSHTSHSPARTGVQRVTLELRKALAQITPLEDITYDPYLRHWRKLETWEQDSLDQTPARSGKRGAYWPFRAQLKGWISRPFVSSHAGQKLPAAPSGFLTAEIFTPSTGKNLPQIFERIKGPKVAIFHDAISMRMPHLAPSGTVGRFPRYLSELRQFDGIVAVSEDSRQSLIDYWRWAGWPNTPPVIVSGLGLDHIERRASQAESTISDPQNLPVILSVGSIEGRKNHLTLLNAAEDLWNAGKSFELRIIGTAQRETGKIALARIKDLQAAGRPLRYEGWLNDADLKLAYRSCAFTVYPSLMEGFGLPVWESLLNAAPCICSHHGATAETAKDGGCLTVDTAVKEQLAQTMQSLLTDSDQLHLLRQQAQRRTPPTWSECARRIHDWMPEIAAK